MSQPATDALSALESYLQSSGEAVTKKQLTVAMYSLGGAVLFGALTLCAAVLQWPAATALFIITAVSLVGLVRIGYRLLRQHAKAQQSRRLHQQVLAEARAQGMLNELLADFDDAWPLAGDLMRAGRLYLYAQTGVILPVKDVEAVDVTERHDPYGFTAYDYRYEAQLKNGDAALLCTDSVNKRQSSADILPGLEHALRNAGIACHFSAAPAPAIKR